MGKIIVCDCHEREASDYLQLLRADFLIKKLTYDFRIGGFKIERKTWNDFQSSIIDGRIFKKDYNLLVIEINDFKNRINPNSILACLARLIASGISIVFTRDIKETCKFLKYLDKKVGSGELALEHIGRKSKNHVAGILRALPGIGQKRAKKIMENFQNLKDFVNSSFEEKRKILGAKVAQRIEEVLQKRLSNS